MLQSERLVIEVYDANSSIWLNLWKAHVLKEFAKEARRYITNLLPVRIDPQIGYALTPESRASVDSSESVVAEISDSICSSPIFREALKGKFSSGALHQPGRTKLLQILNEAVGRSIHSIGASKVVSTVTTKEVYSALGDLLSQELFQIGRTEENPDERLILNHAILIYHLHRWTTPIAELASLITRLDEGSQGIRGKLISIQSRHMPQTDSDRFLLPAINFVPCVLPESLKAQSDVLASLQRESEAIPRQGGFFHRSLPVTNPIDPSLLTGAPHRTSEMVEAGRRLVYIQFEHTALIFMSLTAIEFLLRSYCPETHLPDAPLEAVIRSFPNLTQALRDEILKIFSANDLNLRNRCVHGSFLEIEGRRDDAIRSSGILGPFGVQTTSVAEDGSLPEPMSARALAVLESLAREIDASGSICDTSWTSHFLLTLTEEEFASKIHCDFIEPEEAEIWLAQIGEHLNQTAPCLSTPIKMGILSWLKNSPSLDKLPGFYFLALLFEPLLRLTLHFGGRPVLQKGMSNKLGGEHYRVQYLMIDGDGLLSQGNMDWLTEHLSDEEKHNAQEILRLATKCRDAFAHGAIHRIDDNLLLNYGHSVVKAIQLLSEVSDRIARQGLSPNEA